MTSLFTRFASVLSLLLLLAGCGGGGSLTESNLLTGDSDPHAGVSRARSLPIQGIDVARYQGDIDWDRVRRAGIRFAFIKTTEGGDHIDPRFVEYWNGAARAGVPRGAYHFMYWCRPIHEQALWFILNVPPDPNALPPVLDLEWNNHSRTCNRRVPAAEALEMAETMYNAMWVHTGKKPIIYTDINFHRDVLEGQFTDTDFWLRSVAAEPDDRFNNRDWVFWQFTATGRVDGIDGNVDRNAFHGGEAAWQAFLRGAGIQVGGS
jgi:lysozyme